MISACTVGRNNHFTLYLNPMYNTIPLIFKTICYIRTRICTLTEILYRKCNGWKKKIYPAYGFKFFFIFSFWYFSCWRVLENLEACALLYANHFSQSFLPFWLVYFCWYGFGIFFSSTRHTVAMNTGYILHPPFFSLES